MSVKTTTGYIAERNFTQISTTHYQYASAAPERAGKIYDIRYINGRWQCQCPDARGKRIAGYGERCKHERGLIQRIDTIKARRSQTERQAEEIVAQAEESAELAALRAEVEALRAQIASQSQQPDITAIMAEIASIKAENIEIKKQLATKATARRKHQLETESAQIKEQINSALDEAQEAAQTAIRAAEMARAQLADLESIPHALKEDLDRLTEEGQPELQPDYKAPEPAPEIKKAVRDAQESERKRRQQTERERREKAPLNGNKGFNFYR